ncbi:MAG: RnfABCDGE type electron transport complex subunit D [Clostridia bacterium]
MEKLIVTSAPFDKKPRSLISMQSDMLVALALVVIAAVMLYSWNAVLLILVSVVTCVMSEMLFNLIARKPIITDFSSVITGIVLALLLPAGAPLFIPVIGGLFAIFFTKMFFGGLGKNVVNPAGAGYALVIVIFSAMLSTAFIQPIYVFFLGLPLETLRVGSTNGLMLLGLFLGAYTGGIGVTCTLMAIGGALYLCIRRTINLTVPLITLFVFSFIVLVAQGLSILPYQLCASGVIFVVFFMAGDPSTSPITWGGKISYGFILGGLMAWFRLAGIMGEAGLVFALILANLIVPLLDRIFSRRPRQKLVEVKA